MSIAPIFIWGFLAAANLVEFLQWYKPIAIIQAIAFFSLGVMSEKKV